MNRSLALALFVSLVTGCARLPKGHRLVSVGFRVDPLDHKAQEAIEQIEIVARSAVVHRVRKLPTDWTAGVSRQQDGFVSWLLGCGHQNFAVSDIHRFDGTMSLGVPEREQPEIKVTIWITRGPLGPGRIVALGGNDLELK